MASLSEASGQPKRGEHEKATGAVSPGLRLVVGLVSLALVLCATLSFLVALGAQ
jgi:hypothetical protein